jgi:hypothetical protein
VTGCDVAEVMMNNETEELLHDVVERLQRSIIARDCPAIVVLDGTPRLAMSEYDYLRDEPTATAFEHRAAAKARETGATRWVLAVPQIWEVAEPGVISARSVSNHPLREGEQEAITWMAFDEAEGIDYGRVPYVRRPNGNPIFDEPEMFMVDIQPTDHTPGFALLHAFLSADSDTAGA